MNPFHWKRYKKYDEQIVDAYRVTRPVRIPTPMGMELARVGSYVLLNDKGELWVEREDCFEEWYGAVDGPQTWSGSGL